MASEWRDVLLGDVITLQRGYDLPAQDRKLGLVPVVTSSGISGSHSEPRAKAPGVVMGRYGTLGEIYYLNADFWPHNTTLYVKDFKGNDAKYIYYLLKTLDFTAHSDKTSVPGLNRNHLHTMKVRFPTEESEQRRIAAILSGFDDKIELNRRMNATLEATARALFKSWFVDFDPVRAKMEGRQPEGMDAETAALFPDRLVESPLGQIPEGWRVGTLEEVANNPRRGVQPQSLPEGTFYIGLEHMPQRSISLSDWGVATDVESNKYQFQRGEILFGKLRPYFHKVGIAPVDGICSTDILVVTPSAIDWWGFALMTISDASFIDYTTQVSGGTRMPRVNWTDMAKYEVVIPTGKISIAFSKFMEQTGHLIVGNIHQSRTLAAVRDALLPKLVSGEIRLTRNE